MVTIGRERPGKANGIKGTKNDAVNEEEAIMQVELPKFIPLYRIINKKIR